MKQHIYDLEKTISLNQDCINKIIPTLDLKDDEKKKLLKSIEKLYRYFNNKQEFRQKIRDIQSKMLMNKQIIEEFKRRKDEVAFMHKDQINNLKESVTKKGTGVKAFQKKFNEVEIFIQKESITPENVEKYGMWKSFTVVPFMKKNEDLLKRKCYYEQEINKLKKNIDSIQKENDSIKEGKKEDQKIIAKKDKNKIIEKYYNNYLKLYEYKKEMMKMQYNFLSDCNFKKSAIPSIIKAKNPISNLNVNLNLLEPGIVELQLNLKKFEESEEIKMDEKEHINQMNLDLNKINDKFEKELKRENNELDLKDKELKPPENDDWGNIIDAGEL